MLLVAVELALQWAGKVQELAGRAAGNARSDMQLALEEVSQEGILAHSLEDTLSILQVCF